MGRVSPEKVWPGKKKKKENSKERKKITKKKIKPGWNICGGAVGGGASLTASDNRSAFVCVGGGTCV